LLNLRTETDIECLRQAALLLEQEVERLHERLALLVERLAVAEGASKDQLELEIQWLKEKLDLQTRTIFAPSSETRSRLKATEEKAEPPRVHGRRTQPSLPMIEVVHELDVPDQICPDCGGNLRPMKGQFEESEEIDVVERSFRIVRHKRQKYTCRCGGRVETALGPDKLVAGGRYSVDFAVDVAISKFADHLPLERQVRQMAREGLEIDSSTLWDQTFLLSQHLEPSYEALDRYVLDSEVIAADETWWRLMKKGSSKRWWVWSIAREDAVSYRLLPSRSAQAARSVLGDYSGVVMCDGYKGYETLKNTSNGSALRLAHCWSHVRRKFLEAEPHYPEAGELITLIGKLYAIEAEAKRAGPGERLRKRREQSKPVVDEIRTWLMGRQALPRSGLGKAIRYTGGLWSGLVRFLDDPRIPLDSNHVERALRAIAVGRKNHYGSRSERGTRVAALLYSLIESARLVGVEPRAYLKEAAVRAIRNPGTITLATSLQ
jgi:transposase